MLLNKMSSKGDVPTAEEEGQQSVAAEGNALLAEQLRNEKLQKDLQERTEERDALRNTVSKLEKEVAKFSLETALDKSENAGDLVAKCKSMLFEKTKMLKNQELQIEALSQQIASLKEIVTLSKDMLDIRNMEVKQLQEKLTTIELKFIAEKDRHQLMNEKLQRMVSLNGDLKVEYEKQIKLFTDLQQTHIRQQALMAAPVPQHEPK